MNSREIRLRMKSFEQKIARTNYHVEFYFDDKSKIDIKDRMMRVIRQSVEDDSLKSDMLS